MEHPGFEIGVERCWESAISQSAYDHGLTFIAVQPRVDGEHLAKVVLVRCFVRHVTIVLDVAAPMKVMEPGRAGGRDAEPSTAVTDDVGESISGVGE